MVDPRRSMACPMASRRHAAPRWRPGSRDAEGLYLASDSDKWLLIYFPFMQVVKLHFVLFKGPKDVSKICNSLSVWVCELTDLCEIVSLYVQSR
ncbi:PITH domain-containing protein [Zea mays]|uniref:PITH domain-containing protein n=1 Tax=Zea mays TaxID=4577 RepID=A0A1D6HRQ1_MAIZE|nr:PITH domain-containing protein [Zea mays]